jgi:hypothetical protein
MPALFLVPLVLVFPALRGSVVAEAMSAIAVVALGPIGVVALLTIVALPAVVIVAMIKAIRRGQERRWYVRNDYDGLRYQIPLDQGHASDEP